MGFLSTLNVKRAVTLALFACGFLLPYAQIVTIPAANTNGTGGGSTNARKPFGSWYGHERSAIIYSAAEVGATGNIDSIGFYVNAVSTPGATTPVKIYLKETAANTFAAATTFATELSGATLVYSGTVTSAELVAGQWITKALQGTFVYGGVNNLQVLVETNVGATGNEGSTGKSFRYSNSSTPNYYFQYWEGDNAAPTGNGTLNYYRPNIKLSVSAAVACTGTPTAGTTASTLTAVCPNTVYTLTLPGIATNTTGLTYQWITSTDGVNYTNVPGGTQGLLVDSTVVARYYRAVVTCTGGGLADTSTVLNITLNPLATCYCTPTYSSGCGGTGADAVTNVTLNTLNNTTTCAASPYYTFYNSVTVPDIQQSTQQTVSVTFGSDGSQYGGVWIDFNQDADFNDPGEFIGANTATAGASGTVNFTFTVPLGATLGQTIMRVRGGNDEEVENTPCGASSSSWGESEDYFVNVTAAPACVPATSVTVNTIDVTATVTWVSTVGNTTSIEYGPDGFTPGTGTVVGGVTSPYTITGLAASTAYDLYVVDTCTGAVTAPATGPVSFSTLCSPYPYPGSGMLGAIEVSTFPFSDLRSTDDSCIGDAYPQGGNGKDLFYRIIADSCASEVTFSLCGTTFDTYLYILDSAGINVIDESDDDCSTASEITFTVEPGATYIAVVEPYDAGDVGDYVVNVTHVTSGPVTATSFTSPSCAGVADGSAAVEVTAFATQPISYLWSTGGTNDTIDNITSGTYYVTVTTGCGTVTDTVVVPAVFNVAVTSVSHVSCNGGSDGEINITVNNGALPYVFNWSNSSTDEDLAGLAAGTYCVTVGENGGCTATVCATVNEPAALAISETVTNVLCNGTSTGEVDITVTGGVENVVVDTLTTTFAGGNGCTNGNMFNLQALNNVSLTQFDVNADVFTQTVSIYYKAGTYAGFESNPGAWTLVYATSITGLGNGGPTPVVLPSALSLPAGQYAFYVDAELAYTDVTAVTTYSSPDLVLSTGAGFCSSFDGPINNRAWNGNIYYTKNQGYNYSWSNNATTQDVTGLAAGAVTVTVTDFNACTISETYTLTEPAALAAIPDSLNNVSCNGLSDGGFYITVVGGTAPYDYLWSNGATTEDLANVPAGLYTGTVTDDNGCTLSTPQPIPVTEPAVLAIAFTSVDSISCNGANDGAIDITVTGGTPGYVYGWSNNATTADLTGLSPDTYTINVTDTNGCTATGTRVIAEPDMLMLMWDSTLNAPCNGGNGGIYVTPMGGTTPYTFSWSNNTTAEDLVAAAGEYTVNLTDANGCTVTAITDTIEQPAALTAGLDSVDNATCNGVANGAIYVTVTGGTGSLDYDWSNNATTEDVTGLTDGNYSLTATDDNGCTVTISQAVTEPAALVVTSDSTNNVKCFGGTTGGVFITVTGGTTPYDYDWSNNATTQDLPAVGPGSYTATVTDANGCTVTATAATVTQPAAALTATSTNTNQIQGGALGSVNVTPAGGTTPYTYLWSNNATTQDLTAVAAGVYTLTITDANGCSTTVRDTVDLVIGIEEIAGGYTVSMYPNPTQAEVTFDVTLPAADNVSIEVYTVTGQVIRRITERDVTQTSININLGDEAEGVYLARITVGNQTVTKRVMVAR